jgi:hypothetical protein
MQIAGCRRSPSMYGVKLACEPRPVVLAGALLRLYRHLVDEC